MVDCCVWIGSCFLHCSAARLIGRIPKFGHVSGYMHDVLHWLPSEQRIAYRISAMVCRSLLGLSTAYLCELCCPILGANGSQYLRSSEQGLLYVPFDHTSIRQNRVFSVVGPSSCNGLRLEFCLFSMIFSLVLSYLKTVLFSRAGVESAYE